MRKTQELGRLEPKTQKGIADGPDNKLIGEDGPEDRDGPRKQVAPQEPMGPGDMCRDVEPGDSITGTKGFGEAEGSNGADADQGCKHPGARKNGGSGTEETGNPGVRDPVEVIIGPGAVMEPGAEDIGGLGDSGME